MLRSVGFPVLFVGLGVAFVAGLGERPGWPSSPRVRLEAVEHAAARAADAEVAWQRARGGSGADLPEGLARTVASALLVPGLSMSETRTRLGAPDAVEGDGLEWVYTVPRDPSFEHDVLRIHFDQARSVRSWETSETRGIPR